MKVLTDLANQRNASAQVLLGLAYLHGQGVKNADPAKAVGLFNAAAIQGDPQGEYYLGLCKWQGKGVNKDKSHAVSLFESTARKGNDQAQLYAGLAYLQGDGVNQSTEKAGIYLRASARQGNVTAANILQQTPHLKENPNVLFKNSSSHSETRSHLPSETVANNSMLRR